MTLLALFMLLGMFQYFQGFLRGFPFWEYEPWAWLLVAPFSNTLPVVIHAVAVAIYTHLYALSLERLQRVIRGNENFE